MRERERDGKENFDGKDLAPGDLRLIIFPAPHQICACAKRGQRQRKCAPAKQRAQKIRPYIEDGSTRHAQERDQGKRAD